ncbi:MAG: hypothetical protein P8176_08890 [Gammaproteobacteria bacterium]
MTGLAGLNPSQTGTSGDPPVLLNRLQHSTTPPHQNNTWDQDSADMKEHTLDLKKAAELARKLKALGTQDPHSIIAGRGSLPALPTNDSNTNNSKKPKAPHVENTPQPNPPHLILDAQHVKTEIIEHITTVQRTARLSTMTRIKSGELADVNSTPCSEKIERMIQDIVDLYVPLFEQELRSTLRNDILTQLMQVDTANKKC